MNTTNIKSGENTNLKAEVHQEASLGIDIMKTLFTIALLTLSINAFADNIQQQRMNRHGANEGNTQAHEEMEAIYSNPQGLQNIDERFWNLYNKASDNLGNAANKVNDTTNFTWSHDIAHSNPQTRNQYQTLLNIERPLVQQWIEQRNQLINIINTAKQGGIDTTSYENSFSGLTNTANNMIRNISQRSN